MRNKSKRKPLHPWAPAYYRIKVEGRIAADWADLFPGMHIATEKRADQTVITALSGRVMDQSELSGVLNSLTEMHLSILSVEHIGEKQDASTAPEPSTSLFKEHTK